MITDCPVLVAGAREGGDLACPILPGSSGPGHALNPNRQQQAAPSVSHSAVKPPSITVYMQPTFPVFPKPFLLLLEDPFYLGTLHM